MSFLLRLGTHGTAPFTVFTCCRNKRWLINIRRKDLDGTTAEYRNKNVRVCSEHFTRECFMNDKRQQLTWTAVPTLFSYETKQVKSRPPPTPREPPTLKRSISMVSLPSTSRSEIEHSYVKKPSTTASTTGSTTALTTASTTPPSTDDKDHLHDSLVSVSITSEKPQL